MGDSIEKIIAEMRRVESNPRESHVLAAVVGSWADRLRALAPAPSEPTMAGGGEWLCFHCDETFTDRDAAAVHFGTHEYQIPACLIDAAEYRRMEAKEARYAEEDADCVSNGIVCDACKMKWLRKYVATHSAGGE